MLKLLRVFNFRVSFAGTHSFYLSGTLRLHGRFSAVLNSSSFRFLSVLGAAWISLSGVPSGFIRVNFLARPNKEAGSCEGVNGPSVFTRASGLFSGLSSTVSLMHVCLEILGRRALWRWRWRWMGFLQVKQSATCFLWAGSRDSLTVKWHEECWSNTEPWCLAVKKKQLNQDDIRSVDSSSWARPSSAGCKFCWFCFYLKWHFLRF